MPLDSGLRIFGGCTDERRHALTLTLPWGRGNLRADRALIFSFSQREKAGMREDRPTFPQKCVDPLADVSATFRRGSEVADVRCCSFDLLLWR